VAADGVFRVSLETPAHALLACTVLFAESRLVVHISGSIFD
jgi:predicted xylose isomerase-like sugar epimerase